MSQRNSYTTASRLDWNEAINLMNRLYKDKEYRWSLFIGCGIFCGLRVSDTRLLTWRQLLGGDSFTLIEKKTKKRRTITINKQFQKHIKDCHAALGIINDNEHCFLSRKHTIYSIQRINKKLKIFKERYNIESADNFTSHSLRKTFSYRIWSQASKQGKGDLSLILLQNMLGHDSCATTRRYIGLRDSEIADAYSLLQF